MENKCHIRNRIECKSKVMAINSLAIPARKYSFDIINWTLAEIKKGCKVRKSITYQRMHHSRADTECLYIKTWNGGRGLIQVGLTYKTTDLTLKKYLDTTIGLMLQLVNIHEKQKKTYSISEGSNILAYQFNLTLKEIGIKDKATEAAKTSRNKQNHKHKIKTPGGEILHGWWAKRIRYADRHRHNKDYSMIEKYRTEDGNRGINCSGRKPKPTNNYQPNVIKGVKLNL